MADSLQRFARLLSQSLEPAARALADDDAAIIAFVAKLGWTLPSVPPSLKSLGATLKAISNGRTKLDLSLSVEASGGTVSADIAAEYVGLAANVAKLMAQLKDLPAALNAELPAAFTTATNFGVEFPNRLLDLGLYELMIRAGKRIEPILRLTGLLEVVEEAANAAQFQPAYVRRKIHWNRLADFLKDPPSLLGSAYGWGSASFDGRRLLDEAMHLSFMLAGPAAIDWPTPARVQALTGALPDFGDVGPPQLRIPLIQQGPLLAEVTLLPLEALAGAPPGIAVALSVNAAVPPTADLSDRMTVTLDDPTALAAGVSIAIRPGRPVQARLGLEGPTGSSVSAGRTGATLKIGGEEPMELLDFPGGLRLEAAAVMVAAGVSASATGPYLNVGLAGGKLTLALGGKDGFLERIIPGGPVELAFDLNLEWTSKGVALRGSGELMLAIPLHQELGPFELDSLYLAGGFKDAGLRLETSLGGKAQLGPIVFAVDRVGMQATLVPKRGNLGPIDVQLGFKPPTGVGLSLDAANSQGRRLSVLRFEPREEYAGVWSCRSPRSSRSRPSASSRRRCPTARRASRCCSSSPPSSAPAFNSASASRSWVWAGCLA